MTGKFRDNIVPGAIDDLIGNITSAAPAIAKLMVIGYTAPFNSDTTACNDVSFSFLAGDRNPQYLTQSNRLSANGKITNLNGVLSAAVDRDNGKGGPQVVFVDYSAAWDGHRFCEEGVSEPAKNHDNTWFYNLPQYDTSDISSDSTTLPDATTC